MSSPSRAHVAIYTTSVCGYCLAAKRLLEKKGVTFEEIRADASDDLRLWLSEVSGQLTVPQIFINGASIGGYSELSGLDRQGKLDGLLGTSAAKEAILHLRR